MSRAVKGTTIVELSGRSEPDGRRRRSFAVVRPSLNDAVMSRSVVIPGVPAAGVDVNLDPDLAGLRGIAEQVDEVGREGRVLGRVEVDLSGPARW